MIINSNFKDYYDFVAHQYRDPKCVYNRETVEHVERGVKTVEDLSKANSELSFGMHRGVGWNDEESVDAVIIGGKVYQYHVHYKDVECHRANGNFMHPKYCFQEKTIQQAAGEGFRLFRQKWRDYEWGQYIPKFNDLCVKYGPIIWFNDNNIVSNPCFRENNSLMNILDPYTMVQDIMACIGSVEPHIPEMDDITKVEAAGFDKKISFRHRK